MLEDFQIYHATTQDAEGREWIETTAFAIAVPIAYIAAVAIAVSVALIAPEEASPETAAAEHVAAQ